MSRYLVVLLVLAGAVMAADRQAERAFRDGQRLEKAGKLIEALDAYTRAAQLEPRDPKYIFYRELTKQRAAFQHVNAGVRLAQAKHYDEAIKEFQIAEKIDPSNDATRQEMERVKAEAGIKEPPAAEPVPHSEGPELVSLVELHPKAELHSWNLQGDPKALFLAIGAEYGIEFNFDESVPTKATRLRLDNADFATAVIAVAEMTKTFVAPLTEKSAMVSANTVEKRVAYERMVVRSIDVSQLEAPEAITEVANALRTVLEMRFVQPSLQRKEITVRDSAAKVAAAEAVVKSLTTGRAEVLLELQTLEVDQDFTRDLGLNWTLGTTVFRLTPAGNTQAAFPLSQAFRGGTNTYGVSMPSVTLNATLGNSVTRRISASTVRAAENQAATFMVGERYPIMNASFSPILFSGAVQQQQAAGTLINPFPSFTFEDIGIKLKVTARIHRDGSVSMAVAAQSRALSGQNVNGVPIISNEETEQQVRVADGEPTIISGFVSRQERMSVSGTPLLAQAPVIGYLFGERSSEVSSTEIIMILTPHILHDAPDPMAAGIPFPSEVPVYVPVAK